MNSEEKKLLIKDLCARLPYGVKILHKGWNYEWDDELSTVERVVGIDKNFIYTKVIDTHNGEEYKDNEHCIDLFDDKLFLRPMSSMTEEEHNDFYYYYYNIGLEEIKKSGNYLKAAYLSDNAKYDWLNKHHFDYRYLIEKGLAIAATEEYNPYKE